MAGMGPPPKPASQRRRRNAVPGTVELPAEGRHGDPPVWPLQVATAAEDAAWRQLWASPQAVAWERLGEATVSVVARYARLRCAAEVATATGKSSVPLAQMLGELRQLEDRLGLSPMAMLRLRWEIVADEVAEARAGAATAPPTERRIRAVE
ncbi:DASH complex subunit DAD3 family protein [Frankia sp. Cj3]|uniref:DASH complex subunit DAD3 family protein n=1 Tax=Frankia sp. Cj3 TaxID=2880976 RepID=UPI001EF44426|nr:DASH complex subunit DAD3 family protein [Frankia sp. Cj3]